jgi:hypothetical protein
MGGGSRGGSEPTGSWMGNVSNSSSSFSSPCTPTRSLIRGVVHSLRPPTLLATTATARCATSTDVEALHGKHERVHFCPRRECKTVHRASSPAPPLGVPAHGSPVPASSSGDEQPAHWIRRRPMETTSFLTNVFPLVSSRFGSRVDIVSGRGNDFLKFRLPSFR